MAETVIVTGALGGAGSQHGLVGRAGIVHCRHYPTAGPGDGFVAGALQAHFELAGPGAAVNEVGVAIDEAWRNPASL